jgi:undecaprenyl-diphosphatase
VTDEVAALSIPKVLGIGLFQCLAIIPGTSRSGSTILGGLILGVSRKVAAEFSFFLAIPVMFGWSLLKVIKGFVLDGLVMTTTEWGVLVVGIVVAFGVSIAAIRFLMSFIKNHSFAAFGVYRIVLGVLVLGYFTFTSTLFF